MRVTSQHSTAHGVRVTLWSLDRHGTRTAERGPNTGIHRQCKPPVPVVRGLFWTQFPVPAQPWEGGQPARAVGTLWPAAVPCPEPHGWGGQYPDAPALFHGAQGWRWSDRPEIKTESRQKKGCERRLLLSKSLMFWGRQEVRNDTGSRRPSF